VVVAAIAAGLVLAGCGSGDDDLAGPDGTASTGGTAAADGAGVDRMLPADGPPMTGGTLTYGLDAETDGWNPTVNRFAASGIQVALTLFDPLTAYDAEAEAVPYLAESLEPNDDFTRWTMRLRDGITFHDGTPLASDAITRMFEAHRTSPLTAPVFATITEVEATDERTVEFTMSKPWATFPASLVGQAGMVPAPSMLDDPDGSRNPVGSGPFTFENWVTEDQLTVKKYAGYWRSDGDGVQLPYLDEVVFKPIAEPETRVTALETGAIDMMYSATTTSTLRLQSLAEQGEIQLLQNRGEVEESFVLLNTAAPPFDDLQVRQAVAHATDRDEFVEVLGEGLPLPATGPFVPDSPYAADVGFPGYDLAEATRLVDEYEAENGPLQVSLGVTTSTGGADSAALLQQQWQKAGIDVSITPVDQSKFILDTLQGQYQANLWGQHGTPEPDVDYVWWHSSSVKPLGELSLNFARNADPEVDAALDEARSTDDPAVRKEAYGRLQQAFADRLPYIWLTHSVVVVAASDEVRGITNGPLPDGSDAYPVGGPGTFSMVTYLTQTWLVDG
jgi:ABC-type transport system substrate-binding protein